MSPSAAETPRMPDAEFIEIVRRTPLVSIDLIVRNPQGRILLGLRKNAPARDTWFVPGGIIRKGETLARAFARISEDELGQPLSLDDATFIGVFEHFYEENRLQLADITTHYVVLAFRVEWHGTNEGLPRDQHEEYHWFSAGEGSEHPTVHPYTKAYLQPSTEQQNS
jgi:colanic acid biosynthesis protein WcaH